MIYGKVRQNMWKDNIAKSQQWWPCFQSCQLFSFTMADAQILLVKILFGSDSLRSGVRILKAMKTFHVDLRATFKFLPVN